MKYKKYDKKLEYSYVLGVSPVLDLLNYKSEIIREIFLNKAIDEKLADKIIDLCKKKNIRFEFNTIYFEKLSFKENTYALAIIDKYESKLSNCNHLVLINPSNLGNLGTIMRSMVAFNVSNLALIKPSTDFLDPKVISSSMGSVFRVNVVYFDSFHDYIRSLSSHNMYFFDANGEKELKEVDFKKPFSLVFGNEGHGFESLSIKSAETIFIKQNKELDSLNLAQAVSIALYLTS